MPPARNFPPPPTKGKRGEDSDGENYLTFNITVDESDEMGTAESPLVDEKIVSSLPDSGSSIDMTPQLDKLSGRKSISKKCTFGNKSKMQAIMNGVIKIIVRKKGKMAEVRIKDVLWVPEFSCCLRSTGSIRRHRGEFVDSELRKSHFI